MREQTTRVIRTNQRQFQRLSYETHVTLEIRTLDMLSKTKNCKGRIFYH